MTTENRKFFNLPQDKSTGFCQPVNSSVWKDGGTVVNIDKDCQPCSNGKCMMFEIIYNENGDEIGKKYTPHKPEW